MTFCRDDSTYDFTCELCDRGLEREQELFLTPYKKEDKIFCSKKCKEKFISLTYREPHTDQHQEPFLELTSTSESS